MTRVEPIVDFYRSALSNKVKELCRPLETTFGIDVFWYHSSTPSGNYNLVSNQPNIIDYYYGNHFYHSNPYLRHPDNYTTTAILPLCAPQPDYLESQLPTNQKFGMDHILLLFLKVGSVCHGFGFCTTNPSVSMETVYLNHLPLLLKFRDYFLEEWSQYGKKTEKYTVNMGELIGPKYFERHDYLNVLPESKKMAFLSAIDPSEGSLGSGVGHVKDSLTKKALTLIEKDLFSNVGLDEIAKKIGASPSTFMRHFKNSTNQTPYAYIKNRRLEEAKDLLISGRYSVGEVASLIGYENFGAFSEAFKVKYSALPSSFKKTP